MIAFAAFSSLYLDIVLNVHHVCQTRLVWNKQLSKQLIDVINETVIIWNVIKYFILDTFQSRLIDYFRILIVLHELSHFIMKCLVIGSVIFNLFFKDIKFSATYFLTHFSMTIELAFLFWLGTFSILHFHELIVLWNWIGSRCLSMISIIYFSLHSWLLQLSQNLIFNTNTSKIAIWWPIFITLVKIKLFTTNVRVIFQITNTLC